MKTILTDPLPLNVTREARHRVFVGLGWDPNEKEGLLDRAKALAKRRSLHHDMDLSCTAYNAQGVEILSVCGTDPALCSDESGHIYHSGDNLEGVGDGDDEQISVELKDLDPAIVSVVFSVTIKSGHRFLDINSPLVRIGDGYSGHVFLSHMLDDPEGRDCTRFTFVRILRDEAAPDRWLLQPLREYA